jgi:hypothetical protein
MRTLPWVFVPAILVPVDLLLYALIAGRLRVAARDTDIGIAFSPNRELQP